MGKFAMIFQFLNKSALRPPSTKSVFIVAYHHYAECEVIIYYFLFLRYRMVLGMSIASLTYDSFYSINT